MYKIVSASFNGPNHHPLTLEEIKALLNAGHAARSEDEHNDIEIRLEQGIPGYSLPRSQMPAEKKEKLLAIDDLYTDNEIANTLGDPELPQQFFDIMYGK